VDMLMFELFVECIDGMTCIKTILTWQSIRLT